MIVDIKFYVIAQITLLLTNSCDQYVQNYSPLCKRHILFVEYIFYFIIYSNSYHYITVYGVEHCSCNLFN